MKTRLMILPPMILPIFFSVPSVPLWLSGLSFLIRVVRAIRGEISFLESSLSAE